MDNVKKRIIISMCAIVILILTLFGITYAYFMAKIVGNTNDKSISITAGYLELTYGDGNNTIEVSGVVPGKTIESKTFTVENTGTGYVENYDVYFENVINELEYYEDLTYVLECTTDNGECSGSSGVFPKNDTVIVTNSIDADVIHNYKLTVTYNETNKNQSNDMNKIVSAKINIKDDISNFKTFKIYGNSLQNGESTPDAPIEIVSLGDKTGNLFNPNATSGKIINNTYYGVDLSNIEGEFKVSVKLKDGKTAPQINFGLTYIYSNGTTPSAIWFTQSSSSGLIKNFASTPSNEVSSIGLGVHPGTEENWNAVLDAYDIYMVQGTYTETTMPNFEPYGYKIPIQVSGKNLVDVNKISDMDNCYVSTSGDVVEYYFDNLINGKTYTLYYKYEKDIPTNGSIAVYSGNKVVGNFKNKEGTATFVANNTKIRAYIPNKDAGVKVFKAFPETLTIMIEDGGAATKYEPYVETITNIYLNEPIRKVGNYADYIDLENRKVVRKVANGIIDEKSGLGKFGGVSNYSAFYLQNDNLISKKNHKNTNVDLLSNVFVNHSCGGGNVNDSWSNSYQICGSLADTYTRIDFTLPNTITDVDTAKNWLKDNPIEYYYPMNGSYEESISVPDFSFDDNNTITVCSDNKVCASNIEVEFD